MVCRLHAGELHRPNPKLLASSPVKAKKTSLLPLLFRASDEDASARNDRTAIPRAGQRGLPSNILVRSPVQRRLLLKGNTVTGGAAKPRPIAGHRRSSQCPKQAPRDDATPRAK